MNLETLKHESDLTLNRLGLSKLFYDVNVEKSLSLTQDELKGMSAEECGIHAYTLKQYALYLQVEANKLSNIIQWAKRNIAAVLAKEYNNIGDKFTKYEIKRALFIQTNEYANKLYKQYISAKIQFNTIKELSKNISFISGTLSDLQNTKRYNK